MMRFQFKLFQKVDPTDPHAALVGGQDAGGVMRPLKTNSDGSLAVTTSPAGTSGVPAMLSFTGTGSAAQLPSAPCSQVSILNTTGAAALVSFGASGTTFSLPNGTGMVFHVQANANELYVNSTNGQSLSIHVW